MAINKKDIIREFADAIPSRATLDDLADGMDISFVYNAKTYTVNTRVEMARIMPIDKYLDIIKQRAVDEVEKNL